MVCSVRAHRADFVEEERAAVGLLEPPLARGHGAGEGAARVAEELGLEQGLGNGAAVERDEAVLAPRAGLVDGARDHFLAGAGLAGDEHRRGAGRHGLDHLAEVAHQAAAADDAGQAVALFELLTQVGVLGAQPALLERRLEHVQQLLELERLADEVGGTALDGIDRVLDGAVAGHDDADDPRITSQRGVEHLAAVDAGQAQIRNQDVEGKALQLVERLLTGRGLGDCKPLFREAFGDHRTQGIFVVDEEEMDGFGQAGRSRRRASIS